MEKITKNYLLSQLKIYLIRGLANFEQGKKEETIINFGKCKFIKDLILRCYDFDLETEQDSTSIYLMNLYTKLYFSF